MNKDDKKIIKLLLYLIIFGAFCKVGFDVHTYLSVYNALDTIKELLILVILAIIIFIAFCYIVVTIFRNRDKKKYIRDTKSKISRLESKMKSTSEFKKKNNQR